MKTTILSIAIIAASASALADTNTNTLDSISASQSVAYSGSGSSSMNEGNTTVIETTNHADLEDAVPNVFAPSLASGSNPCTVSLAGGLSVSGIGGSVGAAYTDRECSVRESLRIMGSMLRAENNLQAASILKAVSCQSEIYWNAMELASIETGNKDLACRNELPGGDAVALRNPEADGPEVAATEKGVEYVDGKRYVGGGGFAF